jgi:hypothetical protein
MATGRPRGLHNHNIEENFHDQRPSCSRQLSGEQPVRAGRCQPSGLCQGAAALRRYLPGNPVLLNGSHSLGRVNAVDGVPVSAEGGAGIVQPTHGAGPAWMERGEVVNR